MLNRRVIVLYSSLADRIISTQRHHQLIIPVKIGRKLKTDGKSDTRSNFRDSWTPVGWRIFGRNVAVFQNRARWPIFGGFVMRPTDVCQRSGRFGLAELFNFKRSI